MTTITVEIPDRVFEIIEGWLDQHENTQVTVDELKANPKVAEFIKKDLENMYWDEFKDCLENITDLCGELGIEPGEEEDY